ncbi:MAG: DUF3164 family protein [Bacteroidetes bacterium]|nr:DUF3164 family protein [Bacteroidota bacterium]
MKTWTDESGVTIPANRITASEKLRENKAAKLLKQALALNEKLVSFKAEIETDCRKIFEAVKAENNSDKETKGNFIWHNFDRSIKVEVSINERIEFDELLIAIAKEKLESFISDNTTATEDMIKALVMEAFSTSRGKLDSKKVMSLVKYRQRIPQNKYPVFHEAIDTIEKAVRRPDSKTYFRIWAKDDKGEYQNVNLNFSNL